MVSFLWYVVVFTIGFCLSRFLRTKHPETAEKIDNAVKNIFLKVKGYFVALLDNLNQKDENKLK